MEKPTFLYHRECPEGRIFDAAEPEFAELEAEGWVDDPAEVDETPERPARRKGK